MTTRLQRSSSAVSTDYGRHIFAYCNIRTHQVLYSLTRDVKQRALKQLPDLGANNKPPTIRRDSWKPLWTLIYPESSFGYSHGLDTFRKLREWRVLHEQFAKPPPGNDQLWSQEQIDELQSKLDERGGSKITTVWKLIAREKKKARVRNVMDQKANSIADLAAVLLEQEQRAQLTDKQWIKTRRIEIEEMILRDKHAVQLLRYYASELDKHEAARVGDGTNSTISLAQKRRNHTRIAQDIEKTRTSIRLVAQARLSRFQALRTANRNADAITESVGDAEMTGETTDEALISFMPQRDVQDTFSRKSARPFLLGPRLKSTSVQELDMTSADSGSDQAIHTDGKPAHVETLALRKLIALRDASEDSKRDNTKEASIAVPFKERLQFTVSWRESNPMELAPYLPSPSLMRLSSEEMPRRQAERKVYESRLAAPYTLKGTRVQWQEPLDAEYAREWPAMVEHDAMGVTQHIARDPRAPMLQDAIDNAERREIFEDVEALMLSEELEAAGKKQLAERTRKNVQRVRKNERGEYELITLEERLGALDAAEAEESRLQAEAEEARLTAEEEEADSAPLEQPVPQSNSLWQRFSTIIPTDKPAERARAP